MKHSAKRSKTKRMSIIPILCAVVLLLTCIVYAAASGNEKVRIADGAEVISFNTSAEELDEILLEAEERGMKPLSSEDFAEFDSETREVFVSRLITVAITDGNVTLYTEVYSTSTVGEILEENGIVLEAGNICIPKPDAYVTNGATITLGSLDMDPSAFTVSEDPVYLSEPGRNSIIRLDQNICNVLVKVNDDVLQLEVPAGTTVGEILEGHDLAPRTGDKVNLPLDTPVENEMVVLMKRLVYVNIEADHINTRISMYGGTIADALDLGNITLGEEDIISHETDAKVEDEMTVVINRITYEERVEEEEIPFETITTEDSSMYLGDEVVTVEGVNGKEEITYRDRYVDGVLESSEEVSREVVEEVVNEEITVGTKVQTKRAIKAYGGAGTAVDASGNTFSYSHVYTGSGTAYYGGGICATGIPAQVGVVAVDPEIIPYGSRLYIVSCDGAYVYGYCIAGDTGGFAWNESAIADLYYNTYDECIQFGRRDIMVYVLD